jgi:hypothetical protein
MKKNISLKTILGCALAALLTIFNSCSPDENETSPTVQEKTKGFAITARAVLAQYDFSKFDGETSSGNGGTISDRAYFNPSTTDNTTFFDVATSGYRVFKCFAAASNRTEIKEKQGEESAITADKDMEYIAKLESIPANGVTVAQIHNRHPDVNRPLTRVYVENGVFYIRTTTNNPNSSSGTYSTVTGPNYTSGTEYKLRIRFMSAGYATITITTTSSTVTANITPSVNWNSYSSTYYLKAGVYTEGSNVEPKLSMKAFDFDRVY